jgi:hypothetical protein
MHFVAHIALDDLYTRIAGSSPALSMNIHPRFLCFCIFYSGGFWGLYSLSKTFKNFGIPRRKRLANQFQLEEKYCLM